jgi:hypothetical protein
MDIMKLAQKGSMKFVVFGAAVTGINYVTAMFGINPFITASWNFTNIVGMLVSIVGGGTVYQWAADGPLKKYL